MKIATFGSCLSRYTANHYIKLYDGTVISSVYHNRSDAFIGKFIDKNWKTIPIESLADNLKDSPDVDADNLPINILKNQYEETMGLHRLSKGIPFLKAIENQEIDLLIMDNYIDLGAKLVKSNNFDGLFFKLGDIENNNLEILDYLSPDESVENMNKIIGFFKEKSPKTQIIFINFPHNTYEGSIDRIKRTKIFESQFKPSISVIPCLDVHPSFQTDQKQHFKGQQYCAYAGMVHQIIKN